MSILRPGLFPASGPIRAGFSLRSGGVSAAPFGSMNLGLSTPDDPANVAENRRRFFGTLGFTPQQAAIAGQIHGAEVRTVTEAGLYRGVDGLVTDTRGLLLCISAADCAAIVLADLEKRVIGACHAGWRGAVGGVVAHTLKAMEGLGARADRMLAWISPCISAAAFEVGPEVASEFDAAFVRPGADDRLFVDLKAALGAQLVAAGVHSAHVEVSEHCTVGDPEAFFSYRRDQGTTGRMMASIGLVEEGA